MSKMYITFFFLFVDAEHKPQTHHWNPATELNQKHVFYLTFLILKLEC